jgi:hypothetical protein
LRKIKLCDLEVWVSAADGVLCWAGGIAACLKKKNEDDIFFDYLNIALSY